MDIEKTPVAETKEKITRDWKKIVENSKGQLMFCPENLLEESKAAEWYKKVNELTAEVNRVSKIEIETKILLENAVFAIRNYLAENGYPTVWTKEVGFQSEALKEGLYILSIDEK